MIKGHLQDKVINRIKNWDSSLTVEEIAKKFNMTEDSMRSFVCRHNLGHKRKRVKWNNTHGLTIQEFADLNNVAYQTASTHLRLRKIPYVNRKTAFMKFKMKHDFIHGLIDQGFTYDDVARLFNVTRQRIEQIYHDRRVVG